MSDGRSVHPDELAVLSAAQQSPRDAAATFIHRVQTGPLEQPLFVTQTQKMVSLMLIKKTNKNLALLAQDVVVSCHLINSRHKKWM